MRLTQRQAEQMITTLGWVATILGLVLVAHLLVEELAWLLSSWGINL